jgi:Putative Zn-dependent protease, contains TPR repeats
MKGNIFIKLILPLIIVFWAFNQGTLYGIIAIIGYSGLLVVMDIAMIYSMIGNSKYVKGDLNGAIEWFGKAYKTKKSSVNSKISYAYLLLKSGNLEKSEEILNSLMSSKHTPQELSVIKSNLALVQWKKGDLDSAIETLTWVYENYKNSTIYGSLGYFLIIKGDLEKALEFNLEAYDYNDSDKIIMDNLGETYYLRGEFEKAEEIYKKLLDMSPTFPEPYYYYGRVLQKTGRIEEALSTMKKALDYKFSFLSTTTKEEIEAGIKELEEQNKISE